MALTKDRNTPRRDGVQFNDPVAAGVKIYAGSLACLDASGNAVPGADEVAVMAKGQTAGKAAKPAATATAEQQGSLPAGASDTAAAPTAVQEGGEQAVQPVASAGTPGLAAVDPASGATLENTTASEAPVVGAALELDTTGGTTGQDAHLISTEGEGLAAGTARDPADAGGYDDGLEEIEALFIRSVPDSFRRCGHRFTREGHGIALDLLSDEQIEALVTDPNLVVEHCWFPRKDVS
ncbi:hypothetical protein D9M68_325520 [compost metagenome]